MRTISIRVDANKYIASGHVMRCLSIADAFVELGVEILFFTSDYYAEKIIENRGFSSICFNNDWNDKDSELDMFIPLLKKNHPDLLLVDSYQVTDHYLAELHGVAKLAYIDDLNAFDYPVDIVINYSVDAEEMNYPPGKTYFLGMEYAPLRKQFDIPKALFESTINDRRKNKQILITTGASDPYGVAEKVVKGILKQPELKEYRIAVVKGGFWNTKAFDKAFIDDLGPNASKRVIVYENVENMAKLMLVTSIAISAGGSTLYELCACCVPTITFSYADNQLGNVRGFAKRNTMVYCGDVRDDELSCEKIVKELVNYDKELDTSKRIKTANPSCAGAMLLAKSISNLLS